MIEASQSNVLIIPKVILITIKTPTEKRMAQIDPNIHALILQRRDFSTLDFFNSCCPFSPAEIA